MLRALREPEETVLTCNTQNIKTKFVFTTVLQVIHAWDIFKQM